MQKDLNFTNSMREMIFIQLYHSYSHYFLITGSMVTRNLRQA